jgi:hypothetical protein
LYIYLFSVVFLPLRSKHATRTQKYFINRCTPGTEDAAFIEAMKPLLYLANIFINTFGITQPSPKTANRAAWFIAIMLLGVILTVTAVGIFALHWITRH